MKTNAQIKNRSFTMKRMQVLPLFIGLFFAAAGMVNAQTAGDNAVASPTRGQVKMERDEFLKTHQYDVSTENWVLKPGFEAPTGLKSRAEIRAARDEFLQNNRYDSATEAWVPLKAEPRKLSTMSREQLRQETRHFVRTHRWDEFTQTWVEQASAAKRK